MDDLISYLDSGREAAVEQLCAYARFPSVSAQSEHKKDLLACAEWLEGVAKSMGLKTELCKTAGNPVLLARTFSPRSKRAKGRKHFLVYGHYDVQPPEPFDLWKTPPFEPTRKGNSLFGRGVSDNKGQNLAHLKAVEAYLKCGRELPCDVTFVIEGEEEVGSASLATFLKDRRKELACDGVVVSDTGIPSKNHPALTYALRGIIAVEVTLRGPSRDLHSGIFGGSVENPAMALCQVLAQLRDKNGKVKIPGFYEDVAELTAYEREEMGRVPFEAEKFRRLVGAPKLFGEKGYTSLEQCSSRPTLEINGLTSGYQGEGSKTIVPSWARVKITCRLVPGQDPKKIGKALKSHLMGLCPPTVKMECEVGHGAEPYLVSPTRGTAQAALEALRLSWGKEPVLLREGGSIPIVNQFKKVLGAETLLLGLALPDDNAHSPNEKFDLECFYRGQVMGVNLWPLLARA